MGATGALITVWTLLGLTTTAPPAKVVGTSGGAPITAQDLERHGAKAGDTQSVERAVYAMRGELALASEAKSLLGPRAAKMSSERAARTLIEHLFGPAICDRLPTPARKERYASTRWRFVAPPAWHVEDLQLLCCEDARDCRRPEVSKCIETRAPEAQAIGLHLKGQPVQEGTLEAQMLAIREQGRQAARNEYIFYHDVGSQAPSDGRLQTVDAPIAEAVAEAKPGAWIGPVTTRFGHHVLRLKRRRPAIDLPYEDPRTQALLVTELCPAFLLDQRARYVQELVRVQAWRPDNEALHAAFGSAAGPRP
ncbi:MAG: hypothetical protein CL940_06920 [Deltaproteobacteria bacterium]|nr:hypothetical protein [Deltaproteobacteria bacterium]